MLVLFSAHKPPYMCIDHSWLEYPFWRPKILKGQNMYPYLEKENSFVIASNGNNAEYLPPQRLKKTPWLKNNNAAAGIIIIGMGSICICLRRWMCNLFQMSF